MTVSSHPHAGRGHAGRDDQEDDGTVTMFAPTLPPVPRRSEARWEPRPERPPARPPSRIAELFADEEAEADAASPAPERPSRTVAPQAVPVTVRSEPRFAREEATDEATEDLRGEATASPVRAEPIWVGVARGVSAALAAGAATGAVCVLRPGSQAGPGWLEHLASLPDAVVGPALAYCGTALGLFAVKAALPAPTRWGAALAALALGGVAIKAAVSDGLAEGFGPALSWQIAVCCLLALAGACWNPGTKAVRGGRLAPLIGLLVCGLTFPLADGVLGEANPEDRSPQVAARAVMGWWGEALRFTPTDAAR
ncbi:hypothetical protein [Alienimonas chondri]|uniref:Uncharacterized protein n=1 Tax=Alienimonas chondri TaxID=2681879 RepID=A0ABX1VH93_9PLAN|nr:hypothetical protein [Alienimonas chondri]NNJ26855.1 hypothetical protein [Alienimonas chondri]